jgi:hypothetical protein
MTQKCAFFYSWGLLGCLACTPLAAAEEPTPLSATRQHVASQHEKHITVGAQVVQSLPPAGRNTGS